MWLGFFICVMSFTASMLLCLIDWNEDKRNPSLEAQESANKEFENNSWVYVKSLSPVI